MRVWGVGVLEDQDHRRPGSTASFSFQRGLVGRMDHALSPARPTPALLSDAPVNSFYTPDRGSFGRCTSSLWKGDSWPGGILGMPHSGAQRCLEMMTIIVAISSVFKVWLGCVPNIAHSLTLSFHVLGMVLSTYISYFIKS